MQTAIGDVVVTHGFEEGDVAKSIMHAAAGGLYSSATGGDFASGALGGATGEVLASRTESAEISAFAASAISFVSGGSARDISTSGEVADSAVTNNFLHPSHSAEREQLRAELMAGAGKLMVEGVSTAGEYVVDNPADSIGIAIDAASIAAGQLEIAAGRRALAKAGGKIGEQITKLFSKAAGKNSSKSASKTAVKNSSVQSGASTHVKTKDQPWNIRPGQEYKKKIIGRGQKSSKTPGHETASYRKAIEEAKKPSSEKVYLNQGINKVTGAKKGDKHYIQPNRRPDVTIKRKNGKIDQYEVPSRGDRIPELIKRMENTRSKLPEHMQGGKTTIWEVKKSPNKK